MQAVERLEAQTGQVPVADVVGHTLGGGDETVLGVRADDELAGQGRLLSDQRRAGREVVGGGKATGAGAAGGEGRK